MHGSAGGGWRACAFEQAWRGGVSDAVCVLGGWNLIKSDLNRSSISQK